MDIETAGDYPMDSIHVGGTAIQHCFSLKGVTVGINKAQTAL